MIPFYQSSRDKSQFSTILQFCMQLNSTMMSKNTHYGQSSALFSCPSFNGLYEKKTWEDINFCWQNATIEEIECHNECINEFNSSVTCHPKLEDLLSTWHNLTQYNETWLQFIMSQYDMYFQVI